MDKKKCDDDEQIEQKQQALAEKQHGMELKIKDMTEIAFLNWGVCVFFFNIYSLKKKIFINIYVVLYII